MSSVLDAAAYLIKKANGSLEHMRLHKLLYYAQGWSLGYGRGPLFPERIEAWVNGPVVPDIWQQQAYRYRVDIITGGDDSRLPDSAVLLLNNIWKTYSQYDAATLSEFTHKESPWKDARNGLPPSVRSNHEISKDSLEKYFKGLVQKYQSSHKETFSKF